MADTNMRLVHRWFDEVWNRGRAETLNELYARDAVAYGLTPDGSALRGADALSRFHVLYREAFPDLAFTIEDIMEAGDRCAVRFTARGTHQGSFMGLAATGRPLTVEGMCIIRFRDGRMTESWNRFDLFGLLLQIGAFPFPVSV